MAYFAQAASATVWTVFVTTGLLSGAQVIKMNAAMFGLMAWSVRPVTAVSMQVGTPPLDTSAPIKRTWPSAMLIWAWSAPQ